MIINNSTEYMTATVNEGYKDDKKAVILRFPKADFSLETATEIAKETNTVLNVTSDRATTYSVSDILDIIEKEYYTDIWLLCTDLVVEDNLHARNAELTEMVDIITEGAEINESEN